MLRTLTINVPFFYEVNTVLFHNARTTNLAIVGKKKIEIYGK